MNLATNTKHRMIQMTIKLWIIAVLSEMSLIQVPHVAARIKMPASLSGMFGISTFVVIPGASWVLWF